MKTSRYATRLLQPTVLLDNLTGLQSILSQTKIIVWGAIWRVLD